MVQLGGESAFYGTVHVVDMLLCLGDARFENRHGGIQVNQLVKGSFHVVLDGGLHVFQVHFFQASVNLGDVDAGSHLALGVKDLGGGEAHAGLPAVTLGFHAVNESVNGGGHDLLVEIAAAHVFGRVGQIMAVFYIVQPEDTGDSSTQVDTGHSISVTGVHLGIGADQFLFGGFDGRGLFHGNLERVFAGIGLARPCREAQG